MSHALAQAPAPAPAASAPLSVRDALRPPNIRTMKISPDGRHVAALGRTGDTALVTLTDTETLATKMIVPPGSNWDVWPRALGWVKPDLLWISMGQYVWVFDSKGQDVRRVRGSFWTALTPDNEGRERILIDDDNYAGGLKRVNLRTGDVEFMGARPPGRVYRWIVDMEGVPRVVSTVSDGLGQWAANVTHWHRRGVDGPWEELATFPLEDVKWQPEVLTPDQRSLVVSWRDERDTWAMYRYSLEERRIKELVAGHPKEDLAYLEWDLEQKDYLRLVTRGMRRQVYWLDDSWSRLQRAVDAALPGGSNWLSGDPKGKVLIHSTSDVDPGRWYLLRTADMSMSEIGVARPHLDPQRMQPMRIVQYTAPDGLSVPAYLTVPRHVPKGGAPAIVLIHDGPVTRDEWGWSSEVQMLVSRGYAVLQPQFRGSSGFGRKFEEAGYRQWGRAMQDDVSAGARWLVAQGIADARRMCIYGDGYGGYAALWALVQTPDLFRCGVSFSGVSDINYMFTDRANLNGPDSVKAIVRRQVGDPETMREKLDEVSPVLHADKIKAPVLLVHAEFGKVPLDHGRRMAGALASNHKEHEWHVVMGQSDVGGWSPSNLERYYGWLFEFLDRNIGANAVAAPQAASR